jgi:ankyrin repeat protein
MPGDASDDVVMREIQVVTTINHTQLNKSTILSPTHRKAGASGGSLERKPTIEIDKQDWDGDGDESDSSGSEESDYSSDGEGDAPKAPDSMFYRQMLTEYTQENDLEGVKDILEKSKSIPKIYDHVDDSSFSVLHHAAFRGNIPICEVLLEAGADVYATDKFGKSPLHFAIQRGFDDLAHFLLSKSHPLDYQRVAKMSLMQMAATVGRSGVIRALSVRGANVNDRNEIDETPLHMATKGNKLDAMKVLLQLGASVNARVKQVGHTPMHYACMYGYKEATLLLLESGGDAHLPNTTVLGRTPLETAKDSGHRPLFNALLDAETRHRQENEEREAEAELARERKHELLLTKLEGLNKTNAVMKRELKERREEEDLMKQDHVLRMAKEKKNAEARRISKIRAQSSTRGKGSSFVPNMKLKRASSIERDSGSDNDSPVNSRTNSRESRRESRGGSRERRSTERVSFERSSLERSSLDKSSLISVLSAEEEKN